jgi:hypothetical protein
MILDPVARTTLSAWVEAVPQRWDEGTYVFRSR